MSGLLASLARHALLLVCALALAGCGSLWPWGGGTKRPEPPMPTAKAGARVAWSLKLPAAGVGFAPVVAGGAVYAASADGTLARVDPDSGRIAWQINAGRKLAAGVGSDGDVVVVAARDGTLLAFGADGKPRWSAPLGAEAVSVPAVGLGLVVLRTSDNRVSAYESISGKRRWSVSRQLPPLVLRQTSAVAIAPGTAYTGLPGGRLVAISLENGAQRWETVVSTPRGANEIERIADVVGSPLVSGREVCAASFQGRVACFEAATGRSLWNRELPAQGGIDVDARLVSVSDERGHVHAFSRSGASVWRQEALARREPSAPLSVGGMLVVGDYQGYLYLLQRDDGAIAARFASDGTPVLSQPAAHQRSALVQTAGGTLLSITLD